MSQAFLKLTSLPEWLTLGNSLVPCRGSYAVLIMSTTNEIQVTNIIRDYLKISIITWGNNNGALLSRTNYCRRVL